MSTPTPLSRHSSWYDSMLCVLRLLQSFSRRQYYECSANLTMWLAVLATASYPFLPSSQVMHFLVDVLSTSFLELPGYTDIFCREGQFWTEEPWVSLLNPTKRTGLLSSSSFSWHPLPSFGERTSLHFFPQLLSHLFLNATFWSHPLFVHHFNAYVTLNGHLILIQPSCFPSRLYLFRYDLTYKACGCKCGRGHLRKDLDWIPPSVSCSRRNSTKTHNNEDQDDGLSSTSKKKKKNRGGKKIPETNAPSNRSSVTPSKNNCSLTNGIDSQNIPVSKSSPSSSPNTTPVGSVTSPHSLVLRRQSSSELSTSSSTNSGNNNNNNKNYSRNNSISSTCSSSGRNRTFSMSSTGSTGGTSGGASPPIFEEVSATSSASHSPDLQTVSVQRLFFGPSDRNYSAYNNQSYHSKYNSNNCKTNNGNNNQNKYNNGHSVSSSSGRERSLSGTMFARRHDYSSFNILPRTKINSYHIRMEDETSHGNDDIRTLILSTFSANGMTR